MEDLSAIKFQMGDLIRTTQIVEGHQKQIAHIVSKFDSCEKRLGKTENAVSVMQGKERGTADFFKWSMALVSAFLIALYLNSTKPANGAILHKEQKVVKQVTHVKEGKK